MRIGCLIVIACALVAGPSLDVACAKTVALLVGASDYKAEEIRDLEGPRNDVAGMYAALVGRQVLEADIVVLSDLSASRPEFSSPGYRPRGPGTRAAIVAELKALAQRAYSGDQALIYFSGHGLQTPDLGEPSGPPELDGLDEAIAPVDIERVDGAWTKLVTDDEIGSAVDALRARNVFVWLMVDSCHSGTALRNSGAGVLPSPDARVRRIEARVAPVAEPMAGPAQFIDALPAGVAAIYAVQPDQEAIELPFGDGIGRANWGEFTHSVLPLLRGAAAPTFRDLARIARARYDWRAPRTPFAEGDVDRPFLESATIRSTFAVTPIQGGWSIAGGQLDGLSSGDLLGIRALAQPTVDLVTARLTQVNAVTSVAQPTRAAALPNTPLIAVVGARATPIRLKVAAPRDSPLTLRLALEALAREGDAVEMVPAERADVALAVSNGRLWFVEAGATPATAPQAPRIDLAALTGEQGAKRLIAAVRRLGAARNLIKIGYAYENRAGSGALVVRAFTLTSRRQSGGACPRLSRSDPLWNSPPPTITPRRLSLAHCDALIMELVNTGDAPIDVSALYVDGSGAISPLPVDNQRVTYGGRLTPGESRRLGFLEDLTPSPNGGVTGVKHVVLIGVPADPAGEPKFYDRLRQPALYDFRSVDSFGPLRGEGVRGNLMQPGVAGLNQALGAALGPDLVRSASSQSATGRPATVLLVRFDAATIN